ncbi:MAG: AI-2E family transporter, partial [Patescibacteria group bacterium]|nr:AI-2E family transporter [Patescibacteria group bacterium]
MTRRVDISYKTIIFIAAFAILLWIIYLIRDIILLFFVAFIFVSALSPLVDKLIKWKIPRSLAILIVFLLITFLLVSLLAIGFTPLINQTSSLSQRLVEAISYLLKTSFVDQSVVQQELSNLSRDIISFTLNVFENLVRIVSVIVVTFYLLLDQRRIEEWAISLFIRHGEKTRRLLEKTEDKLGAWLRGQVVLSAAVGILVYLGLVVLRVDFALPLAIIAGLLEVVPIIGPIIAAIPAVLIALTVSPLLAALVAGWYLVVQQIEGHIIVPQIMKRAVGLNPLLVILAISVGGRLLGIGGALLAV